MLHDIEGSYYHYQVTKWLMVANLKLKISPLILKTPQEFELNFADCTKNTFVIFWRLVLIIQV